MSARSLGAASPKPAPAGTNPANVAPSPSPSAPASNGSAPANGAAGGPSAARLAARHEAIDVEFNLLRAWREERGERRSAMRRRSAIFAGIVAAGVVGLPPLARYYTLAAADLAVARRTEEMAVADGQVAAEDAKATAPAREREAMRLESATRNDALLGDFAKILAAAKGVRFRSIDFEVTDGIITTRARAAAARPIVVRRFTHVAGAGAEVQSSTATSLRRADDPIPGGVAFEYLRKAAVQRGK